MPVIPLFISIYILILSLLAHKEIRFILPAILLSHIGSVYALNEVYNMFSSQYSRGFMKVLVCFFALAGYLNHVQHHLFEGNDKYQGNLDMYYFFG